MGFDSFIPVPVDKPNILERGSKLFDPFSALSGIAGGALSGGLHSAAPGGVLDVMYDGAFNVGSGSLSSAGTGQSVADTVGRTIEGFMPLFVIGIAAVVALRLVKG